MFIVMPEVRAWVGKKAMSLSFKAFMLRSFIEAMRTLWELFTGTFSVGSVGESLAQCVVCAILTSNARDFEWIDVCVSVGTLEYGNHCLVNNKLSTISEITYQ